MDRDSSLLVTRPLCVPSSAGASRLNSQCTVTGLVSNYARKRKTLLCSNPNDRVRRTLLRGIRFPVSIQETCRHWLLRNRLRIKVEHLARRQRGPNRDELRRSPGGNLSSQIRRTGVARSRDGREDVHLCRCKARAGRLSRIRNCQRDKSCLCQGGCPGSRCGPPVWPRQREDRRAWKNQDSDPQYRALCPRRSCYRG